ANASHFHTGAAGVAGGVILPLAVGPSPFSGTLTAADFKASGSVTTYVQAVAAMRAGTTYFNIHTSLNPGGEIRGQVGVTVPAPAPAPTAAPPAPTVPPTSTVSPAVPAGNADAIGLLALAGLLAAAGTFAWLGRRRSSAQR
ncbi:MAG: CHRD domain-containing protein, partial [Candidatus Limnocylindrales bacterium]|nr:CHRD domain-containing protein [Candidatus Limnocylindrales bacterium]